MATDYYAHWRDVPKSHWRWPNFSAQEIACRGDGKIRINEPALDKLQALRGKLRVPLIVHSAYRSPEYNRQVGGAKQSLHLQGAAFDISMANHDRKVLKRQPVRSDLPVLGFIPARTLCTSISAGPASGVIHFHLAPPAVVAQPGLRMSRHDRAKP